MKSFRYAIAGKKFLRDLMDEGYKFIPNTKVKYELTDIVLVDLINKEVTVEIYKRNVLSNVLELNENYMEYPIEKLITIP